MKLTRRQLVVAAGAAAAAGALAQNVPAPGAPAAADFARQASDNVQRNADALREFAIPMSVEPAFQFKA